MTVQELINRLEKVYDKSAKIQLYTVWVDKDHNYCGTEFSDIESWDIRDEVTRVSIKGCVPERHISDYEYSLD